MIAIPIIIFVIGLLSLYKGNKIWKGGTTITTMDPRGGPVTTKDVSKKMPWTSIGANVFGAMLLVIAIGIAVVMYFEK